MKGLNEFLNEGKYQDQWAFGKYVNAKVGKNKIELVGDKHKKALGQDYKILKNGEEIGSFKLVAMGKEDYDYTIGDKSGTVNSIDELVKKLNESESSS